jgi:hypothetical protein
MKKLYPDIFKFKRKCNTIRRIFSDIKLVMRSIYCNYMNCMISRISKRMVGDNPQVAITYYPNIVDNSKKYCRDCRKFFDATSIEIFSV